MSNSTITTNSIIQSVVPQCAQSCSIYYISQNFNSTCADQQDFNCLCTHYASNGYSLGELALSCLYSSVCGSDSSGSATPVYNICNPVQGRVQSTQGSVTGAIYGPGSMPTSTSAPQSSGQKTLSGTEIAAIVVAVMALIIISITAVCLLRMKRRRNKEKLQRRSGQMYSSKSLYESGGHQSSETVEVDPEKAPGIAAAGAGAGATPSIPRPPPTPQTRKSRRSSIASIGSRSFKSIKSKTREVVRNWPKYYRISPTPENMEGLWTSQKSPSASSAAPTKPSNCAQPESSSSKRSINPLEITVKHSQSFSKHTRVSGFTSGSSKTPTNAPPVPSLAGTQYANMGAPTQPAEFPCNTGTVPVLHVDVPTPEVQLPSIAIDTNSHRNVSNRSVSPSRLTDARYGTPALRSETPLSVSASGRRKNLVSQISEAADKGPDGLPIRSTSPGMLRSTSPTILPSTSASILRSTSPGIISKAPSPGLPIYSIIPTQRASPIIPQYQPPDGLYELQGTTPSSSRHNESIVTVQQRVMRPKGKATLVQNRSITAVETDGTAMKQKVRVNAGSTEASTASRIHYPRVTTTMGNQLASRPPGRGGHAFEFQGAIPAKPAASIFKSFGSASSTVNNYQRKSSAVTPPASSAYSQSVGRPGHVRRHTASGLEPPETISPPVDDANIAYSPAYHYTQEPQKQAGRHSEENQRTGSVSFF